VVVGVRCTLLCRVGRRPAHMGRVGEGGRTRIKESRTDLPVRCSSSFLFIHVTLRELRGGGTARCCAAAMSSKRGVAGADAGVARRWLLLLCVGSFCLGLLFTGR
jgi:hypothetical protein